MAVSRCSVFVSCALVAPVLLWAGDAHAQSHTTADKVNARALMLDARVKRHDGDLPGALESFQAADAIMHVPTTALEVAKTLAEMGRLLEADDAALRALRFPASPDEPQPFQDARQQAKLLRAELRKRIPLLRVLVVPDSALPRLSWKVDGADVPSASLLVPWRIDPGRHVVEARCQAWSTRLEAIAEEGQTTTVTVRVAEHEPQRAHQPAPVPAATASVQPGSAPYRGWMWTGVGLAIAGTAAGAATGTLAWRERRSLGDSCAAGTCTGADADRLDHAWTLANVSTGAFVVAGLGAALGLGAWWLGSPESSGSGQATNAASAHAGLGSVWLSGRF